MIAVAAMSLMACSGNKTERKAEPIAVETETVKAGSDLQGRTYVGVVEEESSTSISFTGSGTLTRVYVEEGQAVRNQDMAFAHCCRRNRSRPWLDVWKDEHSDLKEKIRRKAPNRQRNRFLFLALGPQAF